MVFSMKNRYLSLFAGLLVVSSGLISAPRASAQEAKSGETSTGNKSTATGQELDPLKRPVSPKKRKEQEKALKFELTRSEKKWLEEDVRWIITDEESSAFKQLSNSEERDQFIEQFWLRRNPNPDLAENDFKEEHYRRIAYSNEHFAAGKPGWKTDRGEMYIKFGPPDSIDSHPSGGAYTRPQAEGGGETSTFPFETWRWRYIEGIGQEVEIEFVDTCNCGDYHMTMDRSEKDALLNVPGAGLTQMEAMGMANKADRFVGGGMERLGKSPFNRDLNSKQFDRLERFAAVQRAPSIKFKDLEEVVTHKIRVNVLPFDVRADFVKVTSDTVLVPITLQVKNRDVTFVSKDGIQRGTVNIFGRISTMTGRIAQTFEDTVQVDVPTELLPKTIENSSVYWKAVPLRSGRYRLDLVLKDVNGDRVGTWSRGITVPEFGDEKLASSSLILADLIERVPTNSVGAGNFVIGASKVRPRVEPSDGKPASFKKNQKVNFWMQVYNLGVDDKTKKSSASVEYNVINTASNKSIVHSVEDTAQMGNVGDQVTLEKSLLLNQLEPGTYQITIKVNDNISKQTISPTAKFTVE